MLQHFCTKHEKLAMLLCFPLSATVAFYSTGSELIHYEPGSFVGVSSALDTTLLHSNGQFDAFCGVHVQSGWTLQPKSIPFIPTPLRMERYTTILVVPYWKTISLNANKTTTRPTSVLVQLQVNDPKKQACRHRTSWFDDKITPKLQHFLQDRALSPGSLPVREHSPNQKTLEQQASTFVAKKLADITGSSVSLLSLSIIQPTYKN